MHKEELPIQLATTWPKSVLKQTAIPMPKHVNINHGRGRLATEGSRATPSSHIFWSQREYMIMPTPQMFTITFIALIEPRTQHLAHLAIRPSGKMRRKRERERDQPLLPISLELSPRFIEHSVATRGRE